MFESIAGAYCRAEGYPTSVFYPDKDHKGAIAFAKSICMRCQVKLNCLNLALKHRMDYGIWGGLTEDERRDIRVREVLKGYSERNKKPHEQERPSNASLSSPSYTSHSENHTLQVSHWHFVREIACRIDGIEVSQLLSPAESSYRPNQNPLFERVLAEFEKTRRQHDQTFENDPVNLITVSPDLFQTKQLSSSSQETPVGYPNRLSPQDQDREFALDFSSIF